jgi:endonuclease III
VQHRPENVNEAPEELAPSHGEPVEPSAPGSATEAPLESAAVQHVLRAVTRAQVKALMIEHLAKKLLENFASREGQRPKMLLRLPNGGPFAADLDDVLALNAELVALADRARARVQQLLRAPVSIPASAPLVPPSVSLPVDPAQEVIDAATARAKGHGPDGDWKL